MLTDVQKNYEQRYGKTAPAIYKMISASMPNSAYKGCCIEDGKIVFKFHPQSGKDIAWEEIETHFRNRLCRKISFELSSFEMKIWLSERPEELGEYLTAATDLDRYFRGKKADARRIAEYHLYHQDKDWHNPKLVDKCLAGLLRKKD